MYFDRAERREYTGMFIPFHYENKSRYLVHIVALILT